MCTLRNRTWTGRPTCSGERARHLLNTTAKLYGPASKESSFPNPAAAARRSTSAGESLTSSGGPNSIRRFLNSTTASRPQPELAQYARGVEEIAAGPPGVVVVVAVPPHRRRPTPSAHFILAGKKGGRQQGRKAGRQQGRKATRQQGKAAREQGSKAAREGSKGARQQGSKGRQQGSKAARQKGTTAIPSCPACCLPAFPFCLVALLPCCLAALLPCCHLFDNLQQTMHKPFK